MEEGLRIDLIAEVTDAGNQVVDRVHIVSRRGLIHVAIVASSRWVPGTPGRTALLNLLMAVVAQDGVELSIGLGLHNTRSGAVLAHWGLLTGNSLAGVAEAFGAMRSLLISIEFYESLKYCMEVTPDWTIRQFQRSGHRVVPVQLASAVCG